MVLRKNGKISVLQALFLLRYGKISLAIRLRRILFEKNIPTVARIAGISIQDTNIITHITFNLFFF